MSEYFNELKKALLEKSEHDEKKARADCQNPRSCPNPDTINLKAEAINSSIANFNNRKRWKNFKYTAIGYGLAFVTMIGLQFLMSWSGYASLTFVMAVACAGVCAYRCHMEEERTIANEQQNINRKLMAHEKALLELEHYEYYQKANI